jgi:hypothetical protein
MLFFFIPVRAVVVEALNGVVGNNNDEMKRREKKNYAKNILSLVHLFV